MKVKKKIIATKYNYKVQQVKKTKKKNKRFKDEEENHKKRDVIIFNWV